MGAGEVLLISTITGLATGLGALIVSCCGHFSKRTLSALLGFAAGIMISISTLSLLPSAVQYGNAFLAGGGFFAGVITMLFLDNLIPHLHFFQKEGRNKAYMKMGYFIAAGIALHNLPEGLALGAGYQAADELGTMIALAILLHNIPEGMGIAAPLKAGGTRSINIIGITSLAGLFTPMGTLIGILIFNISNLFISLAMGFAAGAMIYIVSDELIPESHKQHSHYANIGIALGVLLTFFAQSV
ncbi:MAG: ZIP family metal transporter [Desulfitobacteriaceae bacterium]|nr:ZIP family metal transporter [Desulfitobacteriaceae bacterium]MDD4752203.1 ZIP family metal transporter [Desulfitobacteriaceae bacterium]